MIYFKQSKDWSCGPACVRMVLASLGIKKSEKEIARLMHANKLVGTRFREFPALFEKLKLSYVVRRNGSVEEIKEFFPWCKVIVAYWVPGEETDHYAVVRKIDKRKIYLLDPWFGPKHSLSLSYFKKRWFGVGNTKRWFIAVRK